MDVAPGSAQGTFTSLPQPLKLMDSGAGTGAGGGGGAGGVGAAATAIEMFAVCDVPALSVTRMATETVPGGSMLGVPLIKPELLSVRPDGMRPSACQV